MSLIIDQNSVCLHRLPLQSRPSLALQRSRLCLSMQQVGVQPLVRELRSCMSQGQKKKKKQNIENRSNIVANSVKTFLQRGHADG